MPGVAGCPRTPGRGVVSSEVCLPDGQPLMNGTGGIGAGDTRNVGWRSSSQSARVCQLDSVHSQPSSATRSYRSGGLEQMVDNAGIGSTGSASQETANLLMLNLVVAASPDRSTRKLMVGLYKNPCARYP